MGCISGIGRLVLIIVNTLSCLIGLALLACGAVIKYFLGQVLKSDIFDKVLETAFKIFVPNNEAPKTIEFGPLTDGVGIALMVLGCLVLVISLIGICAACCGFKVLLILFMICVGVLVIAQIIVASVFLPRNSKVHDAAKDNLINKLSTDYDRQHINSFTISSDVLFMAAQCCGVNGPLDFTTPRTSPFRIRPTLTSLL
ncbi:uncharacterized protein LOC112569143 [Pomacea canaliculata]|uniref:uncharacterized protein LOC112569143 n=1 Tax=Pomacea canaliculata TaxID=400727 RepID=UPI000D732000|nr:uncharacterized protein LOC112569143 [Pomacea canaliculata]